MSVTALTPHVEMLPCVEAAAAGSLHHSARALSRLLLSAKDVCPQIKGSETRRLAIIHGTYGRGRPPNLGLGWVHERRSGDRRAAAPRYERGC